MIQNERQYKITQTKLRNLEQDLVALEASDSVLHPRKILARKNSLNILITELMKPINRIVLIFASNTLPFAKRLDREDQPRERGR